MIAAVLDHLWQSTLLAVAIAMLALAFRKAPASVRYGLWLTASVKFLVPFAAFVALGRLLAPTIRPPSGAATDVVFIARAAAPLAQTAIPPQSGFAFDPAVLLLGAWALGTTVVLIVWMVRWAAIRRLPGQATPLALTAPMPVLATSTMMEPGLVGVWRPVLLVPQTLFEHLGRPGIDALVAHEACHFRRRDNLTAAIHMLVEALFWFHPMVWWIGGRLVEERERACDEAVIGSGHDPFVYAESLLECCRLFLQSPLRCVAGASGSNLSRRVETIMTSPPRSPLSRPAKAALIAAGLCALASPVAAGWLTSSAERQVVTRAVAIASSPASSFADATPAPVSAPDRNDVAGAAGAIKIGAAPAAPAQRIAALRLDAIGLEPVSNVALVQTSVDAPAGDAGRFQLAQLEARQPAAEVTTSVPAAADANRSGSSHDWAKTICRTAAVADTPLGRPHVEQLCLTRAEWEQSMVRPRQGRPDAGAAADSFGNMSSASDFSSGAVNAGGEQAAAAYFSSAIASAEGAAASAAGRGR